MADSRRSRLWTGVRVGFGLLGLAFLGVAFAETLDRIDGSVVPDPWRFGAALALALAALGFGARGWSVLCGAGDRSLATGYYVAQLGKYIPGGVWQVAGQVGFARRAGVGVERASAAFVVQVITMVGAGGLMAAAYAVARADGAAWFGLLGLAALGLLHRSWMVRAVALGARLSRRSMSETLIPDQRAVLGASAYGLGTFVAGGTAFTLLAPALGSSGLAVASAWGAAWTIGFLALPFPAGVGVREAVLVAAVGGTDVAAAVIAGSVFHRLVTMAAEALMVGVSAWRGKVRRRVPPEMSGTA